MLAIADRTATDGGVARPFYLICPPRIYVIRSRMPGIDDRRKIIQISLAHRAAPLLLLLLLLGTCVHARVPTRTRWHARETELATAVPPSTFLTTLPRPSTILEGEHRSIRRESFLLATIFGRWWSVYGGWWNVDWVSIQRICWIF